MKNLVERLSRYMDACFPILYITSFEEEKCDRLISQAAGYRGIIEWDEALGFWDKKDSVHEDYTLIEVLTRIKVDLKAFEGKVLVLKNIHSYLNDSKVIAYLKDFALKINNGLDCNIVIVGPVCIVPKELESFVTLLEIDNVTKKEIKDVIIQFLKEQEVELPTDKLLNDLTVGFKGLSEYEVKNILALAISENDELNSKHLELVFEQKRQTIKKSGILEIVQVSEDLENIGGLEILKNWLKRKHSILRNIDKAEKFGVDIPKGVLIVGMPGCGKSLSAKAAAKLFEVPLLRLDLGRLMGKYVGESEANMRKAIKLAEAISPCVLWIDEIEKAFAGVVGDSGGSEVTTRLFGTFLTWMQEKKSTTFVVATANDISSVPVEMLRKGRFDEIFYVTLPNSDERKKIFSIHIGRRRPDDLKNIDLNLLVEKTNGYSGADIEGVVKDSIEEVFASGKNKLTTKELLHAIENTYSLTDAMKDSIEKMKEIYERCKFKKASV